MKTKILIVLTILAILSVAAFFYQESVSEQKTVGNIEVEDKQVKEAIEDDDNTYEEELTDDPDTTDTKQEKKTDDTTKENIEDEQVREEMWTEPVRVEVIEKGDGPIVYEHQAVRIHYTGMLADGTVFDSSEKQGEPLEFVVGAGDVIAGLEQGVERQYVGSKLTITIPSHLGYGPEGIPGTVPPNEELVFEVEILDRYLAE